MKVGDWVVMNENCAWFSRGDKAEIVGIDYDAALLRCNFTLNKEFVGEGVWWVNPMRCELISMPQEPPKPKAQKIQKLSIKEHDFSAFGIAKK
jgi:hypothetical protein